MWTISLLSLVSLFNLNKTFWSPIKTFTVPETLNDKSQRNSLRLEYITGTFYNLQQQKNVFLQQAFNEEKRQNVNCLVAFFCALIGFICCKYITQDFHMTFIQPLDSSLCYRNRNLRQDPVSCPLVPPSGRISLLHQGVV
ncbi:Hypothetical predicted protein [Xyrichtys novacula]|uniref:Uncharacterized protein n=1 Tax=Xyrichtys novacula TaxID=13765 RepID=A0AAV1H1W9_XYRNO|nr:Hypothetical predicted protein [Xyrichtys novacula]